jgi:spermidine/putrescine transport system ATP-binding protein
MPLSNIALELRHVRKSFGAHVALADVNLDIGSGEFFTLLGPSGCGKTTLLRLIAGLDQSDSGEIRLFGKDVAGLDANRRQINTVFQHYALFPHMTVAANVGFGLRMLGWPADRSSSRVAEMLALVRMGDLAGRRPAMLSGGQQQRVALARALAPEPRLLLLDEPLSALDLKLRQEMRFELKQLQEKTGVTFVFVTHDQDEALAMSDRIAVLDRGEIVQVGTPAELYERPAAHFVAAFLGNSNFLKARIQRASGGGVTVVVADGHCFPGAPGLADFAEKDVVLAVRPERIRIGHPSASAPKAQVERVVYLGPTLEVHLRAGDTGIVAHVSSSDAQANHISRGALVGFSIPPDAFRRIPK